MKIKKPVWSEVHSQNVEYTLQRFIWPKLGNIPVTDISPPMVPEVIVRNRQDRVTGHCAARPAATIGDFHLPKMAKPEIEWPVETFSDSGLPVWVFGQFFPLGR